MTDGQAQRRLRLNYVVAELDAVLSKLLVDVPFITEETLRSKYRQLCGKELKSGLDAVGMKLYDLVGLKFADAFVAVRNAEIPGLLRRKFVNQQAVLAADDSRKDAGGQQVIIKAEPGAVSVDSLDSDPGDAAVAAGNASDDGPPEPKHARMDEPEERDENADDAVSRSEPVVIRVGRPKARVMSFFAAAQSLGATKIQSKNLEQMRGDLLRNHKRKTDRVALSVFDFHALIKNEGTLTRAKYVRQKSSRNKWTKIACRRLSNSLKGLRAKCAHDPGHVYTIAQVLHLSPARHYVDDPQAGKISVKNLFESKYGVRLEYPRLPVVVVDAPRGRRRFVPMECVQLVENKKLLFVSVLAARQANGFTISVVPKKRKCRRRRSRGAAVAVNDAH